MFLSWMELIWVEALPVIVKAWVTAFAVKTPVTCWPTPPVVSVLL